MKKYILFWLLGIPIPILILVYVLRLLLKSNVAPIFNTKNGKIKMQSGPP